MTWVRLDDNFYWHPKVSRLGAEAFRLFVGGLCYANRHQTSGFLDQRAVRAIYGDRRVRVSGSSPNGLRPVSNPSRTCRQLVSVGLWEKVDGGWVIHDYFEYQPDPKKQAAGRKGGIISAQARAQAVLNPRPVPSRPVKEEESNYRPTIPRITEDPATHPIDCGCGAHEPRLKVLP